MAFLKKLKQDESDLLTPKQMRDLAERDINGRQIKNIVKTASALAKSRQQTVNYHLKEVLDIMMQFEARYVCASCLFNKGLDDLPHRNDVRSPPSCHRTQAATTLFIH